jgi:hypothetical protein
MTDTKLTEGDTADAARYRWLMRRWFHAQDRDDPVAIRVNCTDVPPGGLNELIDTARTEALMKETEQ